MDADFIEKLLLFSPMLVIIGIGFCCTITDNDDDDKNLNNTSLRAT